MGQTPPTQVVLLEKLEYRLLIAPGNGARAIVRLLAEAAEAAWVGNQSMLLHAIRG